MYQFVDRARYNSYRLVCEEVLQKVYCRMKKRYKLTADIYPVGSGKYRLVTQDGNGPFDLDYNVEFHKLPPELQRDPHKLKDEFRLLFDEVGRKYFLPGKDSKSSIKFLSRKDNDAGRNRFSVDIGLIRHHDVGLPNSRLIHDKAKGTFSWEESISQGKVRTKIQAIRAAGKWQTLREKYLDRKNLYLSRQDENHPSYVVLTEVVNEYYPEVVR